MMTTNIIFIFITMIVSASPNASAMQLTSKEEPSQDQRRIKIFRKYLAEIENNIEKHEDYGLINIIINMLIADYYAKPGISRDEILALFNGLEAMGISLHSKLRIAFEQKIVALRKEDQKRIAEISRREKELALERNLLMQELEKLQNQVWDIPCIDGAILQAPFKVIALASVLKNQVEQNAIISTVPFPSLIIKKLFSYLEIIENSLVQNIDEKIIIAYFAQALAFDPAIFTAADILRCKYMISNSTSQKEAYDSQQNVRKRPRSSDERETRDKSPNKKSRRNS